MHSNIKIAVLLTVFNRKQKTLACLASLQKQQLPAQVQLQIHLTDDGSTDGTFEAVKQEYPFVNIYKGSGSLYWAGGMRHTWQKALPSQADYYLLLNDDTLLFEQAVTILLQCTQNQTSPAIYIGSTVNTETGKTSYGGSRLTSNTRWKSAMLDAPNEVMPCDFGNANIMLVPSAIVQAIGILSQGYTHGLADYDYTLRANKAGFKILIAPGFLGSCVDDHGLNWRSQKVPLKERIKYLKSPKGLAYGEYLLFIKRHFPLSYPAAFCKLWLKTFFPFLWDSFKKKPTLQQQP